MIKVLIADDQALIRESLQIILSAHADIEVVGTVGDGKEVLEKLHRVRPDVILMDIRMPVMDGVLCTKAVKEQYPDVKIIILTTFDDDEFIFSALKYGASGYILKGFDRRASRSHSDSLSRRSYDQSQYCHQGLQNLFTDGPVQLCYHSDGGKYRGHEPDGVEDYPADWLWNF